MRFEVYEDSGGNWRRRLISSNGQTVASAGESFPSQSNARRAADAFRAAAAQGTFEVYADSGGNHRRRAKASNGQTVASSGESFSSKCNAGRAAGNVQVNAGRAATAQPPGALSRSPGPGGSRSC